MTPITGDQQPSLLDRFLTAVEDVTGRRSPYGSEDRWLSLCCPGHDDANPSLSVIYDSETDSLGLRCHTACTNEHVVASIGWQMRDLYGSPATPWTPRKVRRELTMRDALALLIPPPDDPRLVHPNPDRPAVAVVVAHCLTRAEQQALMEATPEYWLRRAEGFAAVGTEKCHAIAQACRNKAEVVTW